MVTIIQVDMFDDSYNSVSRPIHHFRPGDKVMTVTGPGKIKKMAHGQAFVLFDRVSYRGMRGCWFGCDELTPFDIWSANHDRYCLYK